MQKISEVTSVDHHMQINGEPHPECVSLLSVLFLELIQFHVLPSTKRFVNRETIVYYVNKWKLNTNWNNCVANRVRHPVKTFLIQTGHVWNKNENLINSAPVQQNYTVPDEQNALWSNFKQWGQELHSPKSFIPFNYWVNKNILLRVFILI